MDLLSDKIHGYWKDGFINYEEKDYIKGNLNPMFLDRLYQQEALAKFDFYLNKFPALPKDKPIHLLLNLATGSGKTVLMAANILELYTNGYRNFIFIVNSTNIIKKTIANFTEKGNSKYLFADKIIIDFKEIQVNQVDNFETVPDSDINILFSTIQGLHVQLKEPRENGLTFESLQQSKLVILSDEAHHLNTLTKKKKNKTEEEEENSWEWTINTIINNHPENILLEYTATVDLNHSEIAKKYADKILMRYSLKEFRNDKYSKEIKLIKSGINTEERILQALLLSQYRLKVANDNKFQSPYLPFKPVILFKSASIEESEKCFEKFKQLLKNLKAQDLQVLQSNGGVTLNKAFEFFKQSNISIEQLTTEIKDAFRNERCIIVNNENDSEAKQIELNQLEGDKNEIRAIFTVKMLTEGWDVLNLFDIVRLDESNGVNTNGKPAASTISEAQLIGRGARYFPFQIKADEEMYQRKFDKDLRNDLRCLEELYYHSLNDNKYIEAITKELVEQGVYDPNQDEAPLEVKVKNEFKQTTLWDEGLLFTNELVKKDNKKVTSLKQIHETNLQYKHFIGTSGTDELVVFDEEAVKADRELQKKFVGSINKEIILIDLGLNICLKATENIPFFNFDNLNNILPQLKSKREFLTNDIWIGKTPVTLIGSKDRLEALLPKEKLTIAENILQAIKNDIGAKVHKYEGSREFEGRPLKNYLQKDVVMMVSEPEEDSKKQYGKSMTGNNRQEFKMNVAAADWYIYDENYGTSEEKYFIKYIEQVMILLKQKYTDIYLLRNEKLFKIYNFKDGAAFEPDFVLFMKEKKTDRKLSYQLFIEPKGDGYIAKDQWKEDFLIEIDIKAKVKRVELLYENDKFKIFGLPFYNYQTRQKFEMKFKEVLKVE
ncbi:MAG: DEAD/DEAH box helicase family protein [Bacteroidetes bacterium]|nr:DEAD/DEAH box helicase family protein [Bacteroidota bacterium]